MTGTTHPAVDIVTQKSAVVIQDRPLVPLASWLTDVMARCAGGGQAFQILTPHDARITLPLRMALGGPQARWVVQEPAGDGYFDGFSGFPLRWDGGAFVLAEEAQAGPSATFVRETGTGGEPCHHLIVDLRVVHEASHRLELGGTVERLCRALAGSGPRSWGTAEPALSRWSPADVTELCRRRSPQATFLVFMGPYGGGSGAAQEPPFGGTVRVSRVTSGVKETITLGVACPPGGEPPLDVLAEEIDRLARRSILRTLNAQWAPGLPDLTYPSRWMGGPVPLALGLGPASVAEIGPEHALATEVTGRAIGDPAAPGMWYDLRDLAGGDGHGGGSGPWTRLGALMEHLTGSGGGSGSTGGGPRAASAVRGDAARPDGPGLSATPREGTSA